MSKLSTEIFPTGLALGQSFINREQEREHLFQRIKNNQHTVLMSPRRYGKTSLVVKVSEDLQIAYRVIDLFAADSEEYVRNQLAEKVGELIFKLSSNFEKLKKIIFKIYQKMKPEIVLAALGQKLQISFSKNPADDITELLLNFDKVAGEVRKKAVIFIDEFQQISELKEFHKLEAAIRHAVERSKNITYIFSGSSKHLLSRMFGDDSRPLYKLCHVMELEKIEASHYVDYINVNAKIKWRKLFDEGRVCTILYLTERHPFYVNMLCQLLWDRKDYPTVEMIEHIWLGYVSTQRHFFTQAIANLSINQRRILRALAHLPTLKLLSAEFLAPLKLSSSSAKQAVEYLQKKDLVQRVRDGSYKIIDPALRYYLYETSSHDLK